MNGRPVMRTISHNTPSQPLLSFPDRVYTETAESVARLSNQAPDAYDQHLIIDHFTAQHVSHSTVAQHSNYGSISVVPSYPISTTSTAPGDRAPGNRAPSYNHRQRPRENVSV